MMRYTLDKNLGFQHPNWDVDFSIWTGSPTLLHNHCYYELFIVLDGSLSHTCNGKTEQLTRGALRFIHPSDYHKQNAKNDQATTINLSFTEDFINECAYFSDNAATLLNDNTSTFLFALDNEELDYIDFLNNRILNAASSKSEIQLIKQLLLLCFNKLPTASSKKIADDCPAWLTELINDLQKPKNFIYPLNKLTQRAHYSNTTLALEFKKYTGTTAINFFQTAKLKYACKLLKYTDYSTLKIANLCGYFSLSHFNHIFKSYKGIAPTEYRKKHQPTYKNNR